MNKTNRFHALFLFLGSLCLLASASLAGSTVFIVRHAERADDGRGAVSSDPDLSAQGKTRALHLAQELKDAKIVAIFTSEYHRTQQTAAPLAKSLGITPSVVPARDVTALVNQIRSTNGNVLVVGHSNTLSQIMKALGISAPVTIGDADYDNLFVVVTGEPPRLIRLHYR
jgi:broad specificity phosphatase PhoE